MKDRQPAFPGRYKAKLTSAELAKMQAGQEFQISLTRDDSPVVAGTPYSKAAVLPDSIAAMICPELSDPTPADAFAHLIPGYGLGPYTVATEDQLYDVMDNIMDSMGVGTSRTFTVNSTKNASGLLRSGVWFMHLNKESDSQATVSAVRATNTEKTPYMGFNTKTNGSWGPWEYLNPHMNPGTEYRTPFRLGSDPVYVKVVNFQTLPASGSKTKAHECSDISKIVFASIYSIDGTYFGNTDIQLWVDMQDIIVTVSDNFSNYNAHVFIAYSRKDTE